MELVSAKRTVLIRDQYCLGCNETRGSSVTIEDTIEDLKQDADVRLYFPACGHTRTLTADETKRMREAFAVEGLI